MLSIVLITQPIKLSGCIRCYKECIVPMFPVSSGIVFLMSDITPKIMLISNKQIFCLSWNVNESEIRSVAA